MRTRTHTHKYAVINANNQKTKTTKKPEQLKSIKSLVVIFNPNKNDIVPIRKSLFSSICVLCVLYILVYICSSSLSLLSLHRWYRRARFAADWVFMNKQNNKIKNNKFIDSLTVCISMVNSICTQICNSLFISLSLCVRPRLSLIAVRVLSVSINKFSESRYGYIYGV